MHIGDKGSIICPLDTENKDNSTKNEHLTWEKASGRSRIIVGLIATLLWAIIITSWYVSPSADGFGSHTQLGIPKCSWVVEYNRPCPTCGMTTAYSLTARGRLITAFITQPAGCIFALVHFALTALLTYIAIAGKYPFYLVVMVNYHAYRILFTAIIVILAGWGWTWLRFTGKI